MKALDEGIEIGELSRISLKPDDVLVLDFKSGVPTRNMEELYDMVKSYFPNNGVMFLSNGIELKIFEGGNDNEQGN